MTIDYHIKSKFLKTFWKYKEPTTVCNYAFKYMNILKEENSSIMKKDKVRSNYNWNHYLLSLWVLSLYAIQGKQIKLGHINAKFAILLFNIESYDNINNQNVNRYFKLISLQQI